MSCYRKGGCGPYEMLSCSECPASKPTYIKARHLGCPLCNMKPFFTLDGEWSQFESSKELESGPWTKLYACIDKNGSLAMYGAGDSTTDLYYPRFCPECGRELQR